jgi:hypothetical protein
MIVCATCKCQKWRYKLPNSFGQDMSVCAELCGAHHQASSAVPAGRAGCVRLASQPNASKATRTLNKTQKYRFPTWNPRAVLLRITNALSGTLGNLVFGLGVKHAGRSCFLYANFIAGFSRTLPDKPLTMPFKSVKNAIF